MARIHRINGFSLLIAIIYFLFGLLTVSSKFDSVILAFSAAVLYPIVYGALWFLTSFKGWRQSLSSELKSFYTLWFAFSFSIFCVFLLWVLGQWPGLFTVDTLDVYRLIGAKWLDDWYSWIYLVYVSLFLKISSSPGIISIFQAAAESVVLGYIFSKAFFFGAPKKWLWLILVVFLLIPLNGAMTVSINRDVLFSWLQVIVACIIPLERLTKKTDPKRKTSNQKIVIYALILSIFCKLRMESLTELPFFVIFLVGVSGWSRVNALKLSLVSILMLVILFVGIPRYVGTDQNVRSYGLTSMINPLSEIVRSPNWSENPTRDLQTIDHVVSTEILYKYYEPYDIPAFFHDGERANYTGQDFDRFVALYFRLTIRNFEVFFKNRSRMFLAVHGLSGPTFYTADALNSYDAYATESKKNLNMKKSPVFESLGRFEASYLDFSTNTNMKFLKILFSSNFIAILLSIGSLFLFKNTPGTAAAVTLVWVRLIAVGILCPAVNFKYVYGLFLLGFILPALFLAEKKSSWILLLESLNLP